jgi:hypothetical protein
VAEPARRERPGKAEPAVSAFAPFVSSGTHSLVLVLFAVLLGVAASMMMFSTFMLYDDEGYVLLSLRNFISHGHLYGEVYTQYGPFPYLFYAGVHALGIPLTHTTGRVITLIAWSGAAMGCAAMVWRATRSHSARLAVLASVFVYLWIMVSEPVHPGGLVAGITAGLAWLGHRWISSGRLRLWMVLAGAGTAALLLTKINIGVFAGLATVAWLLLHHESVFVRRWSLPAIIFAAALLPFALMRPLLGTPWVRTYALMFACSGVAAIGAAARGATPRCGWRDWRTALISGLAVMAIVLGYIFARGTGPAELLNGVLLGPLQHPGHFSLKFPWPGGTAWIAVGSLILFGCASLLRRRDIKGIDRGIAWLRIAAAAALAITIARFPAISPDNLVFAFAPPCLWVFLWRLPEEEPAFLAARTWVCLLFLSQCLHAFPVPGSQIAWGTFLALPVAALGAWPAATWLARQSSAAPGRLRRANIFLGAVVALFAMTTTWRLIEVGNRYIDGRTLHLPGSGPLRLPTQATALYRSIVVNATAHADVLFSLPGMFSLNIWSAVPTPTLTNVTHWFSLLDEKQQRAIIDSLNSHPRACVVVQRDHVEFLQKRNLAPAGPLYDFVNLNFAPAFEVEGFEFRVRKGRRVAPLLTAELFIRQPTPGSEPERDNALLTVRLLLPADTTVGSLEISADENSNSAPLLLTNTNARVEVTPINLEGDAIGAAERRRFPFAPKGPVRIAIYFDEHGRRFEIKNTLIVVRDAAGEEIALAPLLP